MEHPENIDNTTTKYAHTDTRTHELSGKLWSSGGRRRARACKSAVHSHHVWHVKHLIRYGRMLLVVQTTYIEHTCAYITRVCCGAQYVRRGFSTYTDTYTLLHFFRCCRRRHHFSVCRHAPTHFNRTTIITHCDTIMFPGTWAQHVHPPTRRVDDNFRFHA